MLRINSKNIWNDRDSNSKPTAWEHSTGIIFAHLQIFWSNFGNGRKQNYCFDTSFQRILTNINSTTDFYTLCRGVSRFCDETFSSHSAEKVCRGTRLCFRIFRVSENSKHKRGKSQMSVENMLSHSTEKLHKGILLFLKKFWFRKNYGWKVVSRFSVEHFWSQSAEKIRGHHFNVSENLGYRKNLCIIGGITFFPRKILVSQCKKNSWAPLQRFTKIGVWKILCTREGGGITFLRRKLLSHYQKFSLGNSSVFQKISCIARVYA